MQRRAPVQKEKNNPSILRDDFPSMKDPSIFTLIKPPLLEWSNDISSVFPALKSTRHFRPQYIQSTPSRRSVSCLKAYHSCCQRLEASLQLVQSIVIAYTAILQITSLERSIMYRGYSVRPRMETCRTQLLMGYLCKEFPSRTT